MKKNFIVPQPPLVPMFRLLVDKMSDKRNFGFTDDLDKIEYNRKLFGEEYNQDFNIKNLVSEHGAASIFPVGRFITVLQMNREETDGAMHFFDFELNASREELKEGISKRFYPEIAEAWIEIYDTLSSDFSVDRDVYELIIP